MAMLHSAAYRYRDSCALRWEDIDFKENSALIHANLGYTPDKGVYLDATKTGRERIVYFSSDAASLLKHGRKAIILELIVFSISFTFAWLLADVCAERK